MSQYTKSTNFATKDNLPTGDPLKIVKGTEIDTEYNNIATAIATKTDNSAAAITGGTITGITDLAVADGGTGASTAAGALNNLLPSQTSNANKYLQTDGTNATWDAVTLSTADITGVLPVANGGTGLSSLGSGITTFLGTPSSANLASAVTDETGSGALVFANSPTLVTPALGTPTSATLTNATGLPLSTGISGLGTGVATALAINTPNTGAMVVNGGALGTPSSGVVTNLTGTANININGLVGVTTANNGNFTSINASSTVNLSAGTVDGVLYLDASKNITTGSVLSFSGVHLTSNRNKDTTYSATDFTTYPNGFVLQNSATPATGIFNSIYFKNNGNMQNVFGVVQNSSGYGDFVWAGLAASHTEWMRLASTGLTLTSNPTLSGGTANGVTYLNGSKVLTSGSALTFDGTTFVATASTNATTTYPAYFDNSGTGSGTGSRIGFRNAGASYGEIGYLFDGSFATIINSATSTQIRHLIGGTEAMRLTSTSLYTASGINVGIGTSSPSLFEGTVKTVIGGGSGSPVLTLYGGSATYSGIYFADGVTGNEKYRGFFEYNHSTDSLAIGTTGGTKATLDASGNLGLGVVPSAWSGFKAMQVGSTVALWGASSGAGSLFLSSNTYYDGTNFRYLNTANATFYAQGSTGTHTWNTAASGTAGDAISFTQAMTLTAAGDLGVGATSPTGRVDAAMTAGSLTGYSLSLGGVEVGSLKGNSTTGEIRIGGTYTNYFPTFYSSGSERARIDSSGNLLVGKTSSGAANVGFEVNQTGISYLSNSATTDATSTNHIYSTGASAFRFYVGMGGTVFATSIVISAISDQRLKENVRDIDTGLDAIMALQPRRFDWKDGKGQDKKNVAGFIAQEFETVFPECVGVSKAGADGIEYKNINHETLIPTLVKAIQELKAEFDAYKASHP
jgi:hypothetical protein